MKKIYVLDTSVLIDDPQAYKNFPDSEIVIPATVLDELDSKKTLANNKGRNARVCIRAIEEITTKGDVQKGILLEDNILFRIDPTYRDPKKYQGFGDPNYGDTHILMCAFSMKDKDTEVTLVSNDINLRAKARARGLSAASHEKDNITSDDLYSGNRTVINEMAGMALQQSGTIDPISYNLEMSPHECILFTNDVGDGIALGRKVSDGKIKLIRKAYPWGISSRNKEQTFAIDLLMDKGLDLVTFTGSAGTGKTLISCACALELVLSKKEYSKFLIYRPIQAVGADIGFTPGTIEEKLEPWFQAITDSFEFLFTAKHGGDWRKDLDIYKKKGKISYEAITYCRGRSINNALMLIDEAQNLSQEEIKTLLTRAGEGTKIILSGDTSQIDAARLSAIDNGLTYVIEKFKDSQLAGHMTFTKGERSRLATEAAKIL